MCDWGRKLMMFCHRRDQPMSQSRFLLRGLFRDWREKTCPRYRRRIGWLLRSPKRGLDSQLATGMRADLLKTSILMGSYWQTGQTLGSDRQLLACGSAYVEISIRHKGTASLGCILGLLSSQRKILPA